MLLKRLNMMNWLKKSTTKIGKIEKKKLYHNHDKYITIQNLTS